MSRQENPDERAPAHRVLVIGWDGATFDLLQPLVTRGIMPHLGRLLAKGSHGRLTSTMPPLTSPAWVTFATGKNPGKHSCLLFTKSVFGSHVAPLTNSTDIDGVTMWEAASARAKRVVSINVPMTYPAQPVNGIVLTGMMTPPGADFTFPRDLPERYPSLDSYIVDLNSSGRQQGISIDDLFVTSPADYVAAVDEMRRSRTAIALEIMRNEAWDLCTLVYTGPDRLSHMLWRELEALAKGQEAANVRLGHELLDYFRSLDEDLGRFLELVDDETYLLVMSDHGFGPGATEAFYLNSWLRDVGLLAIRKNTEMVIQPGYWLARFRENRLLSKIVRKLGRFLPLRFRGQLRRQTTKIQDAAVDWEKTRAHTVVMAGSIAGIQIANDLPESERQAIIQQLSELLPRVASPLNGTPLIKEIIRREDLYTGVHVRDFPELIVIADEGYEIKSALAEHGHVAPLILSPRTGDHRQDGILLLSGKEIVGGQLRQQWWLADVTATILHLLGIPLPDDIDGRFIAEAFGPGFLSRNPIEYSPSEAISQERQSPSMGPGEEEAILARLRGLGYVE